MSTLHTRFEIFVSYAHKDNFPVPPQSAGWVTALRDQILEDHRRFSTEPLVIFFDTDDIRDMDDWEHRILGALRYSRILLVCLSPNYFASPYCRREWEEYVARQVHREVGGDSIASVYFVEVPGGDAVQNRKWFDAVARVQFTDVRPWFPEGADALRRDEVKKRVAALGQSLWERIKRARRADVPGNLRRRTAFFVGRTKELTDLHEQLATGAVGLVTAVHGLGGQGKTELAVAYGDHFADFYPAGLWSLGAEGKKELLPLIGELAFSPEFGYRPSDAERNDPVLLGRAVLAELSRRAEAVRDKDPDRGAAALIILDNVSEAVLLSPGELATLPRADFLRVIATTRMGEDQLATSAKSLAFVHVDSLAEDDALTLVRDQQPPRDPHGKHPGFASPAEEAAAREIVRELGGLTLAVEQVAVYLGLHPEVTPSAFLAGLRQRGLASTDRLGAREDVQARMLHQGKQLAVVLDATLAPLDAPARTALRFAALLPPDSVPWPWLKALTVARHPELARFAPDDPDPWVALQRRLEGLRLIAPGEHPDVGRIHRLIAAHLAAGANSGDGLSGELEKHIAARAWAIYNLQAAPQTWELDALLAALPHLLAAPAPTQDLANASVFFTDKLRMYRNLGAARMLLTAAHAILDRRADAVPSNAQWQRDLSASHDRIGDVFLARGDLTGALGAFRKSLAVAEKLAATDPSNAGWQRDLAVSHSRMGSVVLAQGDLPSALGAFRKSLAVLEKLASADPPNAGWQFDLGISHERLGDIFLAQGNLAAALGAYSEKRRLIEKLAAADPSSADWQSDLSVSHDKVGYVLLEQGDLVGALGAFRKSLAVREKLAAADPSNAGWQFDLGISHERLGDIFLAQGNLAAALGAYSEKRRLNEKLAAADPSNAGWQRGLSVSHNKVGDVLLAQGDLVGGLAAFGRSLAVHEKLAAADASNAGWQRDLSVSHNKVGDVLLAQDDLGGALGSFGKSLAIAEKLAAADPSNAEWQRDLSISHDKVGEALLAQGDLGGALGSFGKSLAFFEKQAAADPSNAEWQRDLWVSYWRMAHISEQSRTGDAASFWKKAFDQLSAMKQRGLFISPQDQQFIEQLRRKLGA